LGLNESKTSPTINTAGGARHAPYFSCLSKKSKQKNDTPKGPWNNQRLFPFSRVTPPEQARFTPKQAVELSAANGEGPAGAVAVEGTRRFVAGKEPGRVSLLTFFTRLKKVRRCRAPPAVFNVITAPIEFCPPHQISSQENPDSHTMNNPL